MKKKTRSMRWNGGRKRFPIATAADTVPINWPCSLRQRGTPIGAKKKKRNRDRRMEESDKMSIDLVDDGEDETYSRPKSSIWDGC